MRRRTNLYKIVDQNGKPIFEDLLTAKQVAEKTGCTKNNVAQAAANKELSASITDELIRMKEAEAHYKNGWVTVQGADAVIADK